MPQWETHSKAQDRRGWQWAWHLERRSLGGGSAQVRLLQAVPREAQQALHRQQSFSWGITGHQCRLLS